MRCIALTQRVGADVATGERRDQIDQQWVSLLKACALLPILLPNDLEVVRNMLEVIPCDGVLLTGGNDLVAYGGDAPERDAVEKFLLEHAMRSNAPLLGVCRGMQLILHSFGGVLCQVKGHVGKSHDINLGGEYSVVNSYHCFGARKCPSAFTITAMSNDGVIEAIRHLSKPIYGIMWHPERTLPVHPRDVALISSIYSYRENA